MQIRRQITFLIILLSTSWCAYTQVVFEPTYHTVYPYLSRLAQKGVIDLDDVVLPLSKDYIYSKLDELSSKMTELTPLEREELAFYLKEYTLWWRQDPKSGFEGEYKSVFQTKIGDRFRWAAYQDKGFAINAQPLAGFFSENIDGKTVTTSWKGTWIYGYIGKHIGFSIDLRDNSLKGIYEGYDYLRKFSPKTGVIGIKSDATTYDFNETNASLTAKWKWGTATLGKNYMPIGYGAGGKIILSDKAPSFPHIRLDITPVKWLSVNYAHIWLNSKVVDSTRMYATSIPTRTQYQDREKYMAIHSFTLRPFKGTSLTVGESSIYNDGIKMVYLIPINMFSAMNHYLGELDGNNTIANSQIFMQLSARNVIPKTHLYFSFFVDELRLKGGNDSLQRARNHTAYQLGASVADFPIKNLHLTLEYSKVQPFAYVHFIPAQTYANNNYNLGHWIGPNADQFFAQLHYRIIRGLDFKIQYESIRKGTVGTGKDQISNKDIYPFLWGDVTKYTIFQMNLQYELLHDLFFRLGYKSEKIFNVTSELTNKFNTASFGINYGF